MCFNITGDVLLHLNIQQKCFLPKDWYTQRISCLVQISRCLAILLCQTTPIPHLRLWTWVKDPRGGTCLNHSPSLLCYRWHGPSSIDNIQKDCVSPEKRAQPYSWTIGWLRCVLNFSLIPSEHPCIHGACSARHSPCPSTDATIMFEAEEGKIHSYSSNFSQPYTYPHSTASLIILSLHACVSVYSTYL